VDVDANITTEVLSVVSQKLSVIHIVDKSAQTENFASLVKLRVFQRKGLRLQIIPNRIVIFLFHFGHFVVQTKTTKEFIYEKSFYKKKMCTETTRTFLRAMKHLYLFLTICFVNKSHSRFIQEILFIKEIYRSFDA
jgi:hypothetical protein